MAVTLSEKAAAEVKKIIAENGMELEKTILRVEVKGGGCSGFSYGLGWDESYTEKDRVQNFHGVTVAVEKKFDPYLEGTVIDFYEDINRRGFVFNNPNVTKTCGCGSSFQV